MKPQQLQQIQLMTQDTLRFLYQRSITPVLPLLHPNVTWVSSLDNLTYVGKENVSNALKELAASPYAVSDPVCTSTLTCQTICFDQSICTMLCTCISAQMQMHCTTLVWKLELNSPRLLHIHGSITPMEPVLIFPGRKAEHYYLRPTDILYVEADNTSCRIVCETRIISICQTISEIQKQLPHYFLKIHRSFLVNPQCIISLRRYNLELCNGALLPVPEKKYKWLRQYLDQQT